MGRNAGRLIRSRGLLSKIGFHNGISGHVKEVGREILDEGLTRNGCVEPSLGRFLFGGSLVIRCGRRGALYWWAIARRYDEGAAGLGGTTAGVSGEVIDEELAAAGTLALAFGWLPALTAPNWSPKNRKARNTTTTKATKISKPRL